jgi:hypothetical protein
MEKSLDPYLNLLTTKAHLKRNFNACALYTELMAGLGRARRAERAAVRVPGAAGAGGQAQQQQLRQQHQEGTEPVTLPTVHIMALVLIFARFSPGSRITLSITLEMLFEFLFVKLCAEVNVFRVQIRPGMWIWVQIRRAIMDPYKKGGK